MNITELAHRMVEGAHQAGAYVRVDPVQASEVLSNSECRATFEVATTAPNTDRERFLVTVERL